MIRSLLVTAILVLGVLVPPRPDVHAASTLLEPTGLAVPATPIPASFKVDRWWSIPTAASNSDWRWIYPDFPIACSQHAPATARAFQALWIYPTGATSALDRRILRKAIAAATSTFAASAHHVISNQAALLSSLAPRWRTNATTCRPTVTEVAVPLRVINADPWTSLGLWPWLEAHGFDSPLTKYVSILQVNPTPLRWGGIADSVVTPNDPGLDNAANLGSQLTILGSSTNWRPMVYLLAHEMAHALGAVSSESPHFNTENQFHPSDCFDILCYAGPTPGQSYLTACGFRDSTQPWQRVRGSWRQDCNHDDYFAADNPAWTTQRWAASSSSFLWGNAQPDLLGDAARASTTSPAHHVHPDPPR